MSSATPVQQQPHEAEKIRTISLEKKVARLEADLKEARGDLVSERATKQDFQEKLEDLEARFEVQTRAKDATIQELQTALDNADETRAPSVDNELAKCRSELKELQDQHEALQEYNQALQTYLPKAKGKTAPANQGSKQSFSQEKETSSSPFSLLTRGEKPDFLSAAQTWKPLSFSRPAPNRLGIYQDNGTQSQKDDSASPPSTVSEISKAAQSTSSQASGQAKVPTGPQNQESASKPVQATNEEALMQSDKSMGQVLVEPPPPSTYFKANDLLYALMAKRKAAETATKSKVPDNKEIMDAAAGKVVEPLDSRTEPGPLEERPKQIGPGEMKRKREYAASMETEQLEYAAKASRLDLDPSEGSGLN